MLGTGRDNKDRSEAASWPSTDGLNLSLRGLGPSLISECFQTGWESSNHPSLTSSYPLPYPAGCFTHFMTHPLNTFEFVIPDIAQNFYFFFLIIVIIVTKAQWEQVIFKITQTETKKGSGTPVNWLSLFTYEYNMQRSTILFQSF